MKRKRHIVLWFLFLALPVLGAGEPGPGIPVRPLCEAELARLDGQFVISTHEGALATDYHTRIRAWFDAVPVHEVKGTGGVPLRYRVMPAQGKEKGTIVVAHGYTEAMKKWAETAFNLTENGFRVYMFDHRGHGETPRLTPHPHMVYTDRFRDYVDDLSLFVDSVVLRDSHLRMGLLGYSMGGLISAMYASEHPGAFKRISLLAPMMGVKLHGVPGWAVELTAKLASRVGLAQSYALGQSEKWVEVDPLGFGTSSAARHEIMRWQRVNEPEIQTGGASYGWLATALEAVRQRKRIARSSEDETLVVIGKKDRVIPRRAILHFCRHHGHCTVLEVDGAHNLLHEKDEVRRPVLFKVLEHFHSEEVPE